MCSEACSLGDLHREVECAIFARVRVDIRSSGQEEGVEAEAHPFYQCITPLRCLWLRDTQPQKWRAMQVPAREVLAALLRGGGEPRGRPPGGERVRGQGQGGRARQGRLPAHGAHVARMRVKHEVRHAGRSRGRVSRQRRHRGGRGDHRLLRLPAPRDPKQEAVSEGRMVLRLSLQEMQRCADDE
ncbi:unnamed protein product [Sphagnum tenellum]